MSLFRFAYNVIQIYRLKNGRDIHKRPNNYVVQPKKEQARRDIFSTPVWHCHLEKPEHHNIQENITRTHTKKDLKTGLLSASF